MYVSVRCIQKVGYMWEKAIVLACIEKRGKRVMGEVRSLNTSCQVYYPERGRCGVDYNGVVMLIDMTGWVESGSCTSVGGLWVFYGKMISLSAVNLEAYGYSKNMLHYIPSLKWCPHHLQRVRNFPYSLSIKDCITFNNSILCEVSDSDFCWEKE